MNKILLIGTPRQEEAVANAALDPGHLLEVLSSGKVQKHSTRGGRAERAFAQEDALQGKTVGDSYAANDRAFYLLPLPGDVVAAKLKAGVDYAKGEELVSAGDGTLEKRSVAENAAVTILQVVARVETAIDLSAGGAVNTLSAVRVA